MTQREQYRTVRHLSKITPLPPEAREENRMVKRLARKAQALAAEYGEVINLAEAQERAMENLAWVRQMAGGVR